MKSNKFVLITFLTIAYLYAGRFIGGKYFSQTKLWDRILNDNLHHYQIGIGLVFLALMLLRKKPELKDWVLAISAGLIIDEWMWIFSPLNPKIFNFYHPVGIALEFIGFAIFSYLILRYKKDK